MYYKKIEVGVKCMKCISRFCCFELKITFCRQPYYRDYSRNHFRYLKLTSLLLQTFIFNYFRQFVENRKSLLNFD